jgi:hypothetical protein
MIEKNIDIIRIQPRNHKLFEHSRDKYLFHYSACCKYMVRILYSAV